MNSDLPFVARCSNKSHQKAGASPETPAKIHNLSFQRRQLFSLGIKGGLILASPLVWGKSKNEDKSSETLEPFKANLFVAIDSSGKVQLTIHRSEMGQGIRTSLAQILADELEADWEQIELVQAPGNAAFGDQNTDGSRSIRNGLQQMREMGASARFMLEQAAATAWQVPQIEVRAREHRVMHLSTGRSFSFGELVARAADLKVPEPSQLKLKQTKDYNYIGKPMDLVDGPNIINGSAVFGIDIEIEDMLHASIERCPVIGGRLKKLDDSAARALEGVVDIITLKANTFPIGFQALHGVAVIATNTWIAQKARSLLKIDWELGDNANYQSQKALETLIKQVQTPGQANNQIGDYYQNQELADSRHSATYTLPYLVHASMEPPSACARVSTNACEVWASTQSPQSAQDNVAKALGLNKEQVTVNVCLLGGAFGRKAKADFCVEAALLAKAVKKPVKITWSREDDIQFGYYHAHSAQYFEACFDENKQLNAWLQRTAFPSIMSIFSDPAASPADWELDLGFNDVPLDCPNWQSETHSEQASVRIGWVRSVCNIQHAFGRSSFIDELAHFAGKPAPFYWLEMLGRDRQIAPQKDGYKFANYGGNAKQYPIDIKRFKNVIKVAARYGNWTQAKKGEGWGLAAHRSFLSYVAVATQVRVEGDQLHIKAVHIVIDAGQVVNPDRVKSQMEGSVMFGLSLALMGEINIMDGRIQESNFHDYPMLRMNQCPEIKVEIISSNEAPGGVGEPGAPPIAPSITNAIFAATQQRIRDLPLKRHFKV